MKIKFQFVIPLFAMCIAVGFVLAKTNTLSDVEN